MSHFVEEKMLSFREVKWPFQTRICKSYYDREENSELKNKLIIRLDICRKTTHFHVSVLPLIIVQGKSLFFYIRSWI